MKFGLTSLVLLAANLNKNFAIDLNEKESTKADNGKRCLALTMSGGGTKGAFESGALWGMYHALQDKSDFEYDVVTGVSAGSINTMAVSVFPKGEEAAMIEELSQRWQTLK